VSGVALKDCVTRLPHPKGRSRIVPAVATGEASGKLTWGAPGSEAAERVMAMPELTTSPQLNALAEWMGVFSARCRVDTIASRLNSSITQNIPGCLFGPLAILKCAGPPMWRTTRAGWRLFLFPTAGTRMLNAEDGFILPERAAPERREIIARVVGCGHLVQSTYMPVGQLRGAIEHNESDEWP